MTDRKRNLTAEAMLDSAPPRPVDITYERTRICVGLQCPECYGVNVEKRESGIEFSCRDCGCQWDRNYYPEPLEYEQVKQMFAAIHESRSRKRRRE